MYAMVLEMKFYRVICLASCGTLDRVLSHRERNIYQNPVTVLKILLFSTRIPKKQSSSCPFSSGQAVLKLWWNMSSVVLVSSYICQRKLALSPSCSQVSLMCFICFSEIFSQSSGVLPGGHVPSFPLCFKQKLEGV